MAVAENKRPIGLDFSRAGGTPTESRGALSAGTRLGAEAGSGEPRRQGAHLDGISAAERIVAGQIAPVVVLTAFCQREDPSGTS